MEDMAEAINKALPTWGTQRWRICTSLFAIIILAWSSYTAITDLMAGYHLWWYNLSFSLFAFALLGLVLLVREGWQSLRNVVKYGLHPRIEEPTVSPEEYSKRIETYLIDEEEENQVVEE